MLEDRIITAATITIGDKTDGKKLKELYAKTKDTGLIIDSIIGDTAYSEKRNLELAEKEKIS